MRRTAFALVLTLSGQAAVPAVEIPVLAYHDVTLGRSTDPFAVTRREFARHMQYLAERGYRPISLAELDAVRRGRVSLPPKPVLLTFDDGLKSYREFVLPVLEKHGYPSVLSVVTGWLDGENIPPEYRGRLMSWDEVRAVDRSPLVEIVSHTHNLHHHIHANPQGNVAPAVITRAYEPVTGRYETEDEFRERVRADLSRSRDRLHQELGRAPRGIAWPYGEYDEVLQEEAARLGMVYQFTLDAEPTTIASLPRIHRRTVHKYRTLTDLDDMLTFRAQRRQQLRFLALDLDIFAGKRHEEQERLLSRLLARLELLRVNAVMLTPFTRAGDRVLFYNEVLPVEADILNRVLHQITSRVGIKHRYLKIPAHPPVADAQALYADLARLNRFNGIVVDGPVERSELSDLRALFARYQPGIQVGVSPDAPAADAADFVVDALDAGAEAAVQTRAAERLEQFPRALFLLRRPVGLPDERLNAAMRALRAVGARHYGYDNDDFLHDSPAVLRVVAELHGHTAVRGD